MEGWKWYSLNEDITETIITRWYFSAFRVFGFFPIHSNNYDLDQSSRILR